MWMSFSELMMVLVGVDGFDVGVIVCKSDKLACVLNEEVSDISYLVISSSCLLK